MDVAQSPPEIPQMQKEPRRFTACVFCAMQYWTDDLKSVYLFGPLCTIPTPASVAALISVENYSSCWPLFPRTELDASSVDFPYYDDDGLKVSRKVLMHKRRVGGSALEGKEPVQV